MKAENFSGSLKDFLGKYRFQPQLTSRLDGIGDVAFSQDLINEIVLLHSIDALRCLKTGQHRKGEAALLSLLGTHGVDLPMASTILSSAMPGRFRSSTGTHAGLSTTKTIRSTPGLSAQSLGCAGPSTPGSGDLGR